MSPFPEGTQPTDNNSKNAGNRRRNILLASMIGLALLSLLMLLATPGLLIPPSEATDDGEQEAEATDGGDTGGNETAAEILPLTNNTNSGLDESDQDEGQTVQNTGNGFTGGYVSYPGEVQETRRGGGGSNNPVEEPDDDQGTGGGGGGDDDNENGGPGSGGETGGTEGCDPQYWQNHPENWPAPLTPTTLVSSPSVFNVTIPGMEDLTLMEALGLGEGLADELIREGAAGMLNAMYEEIDYPKSPPTVIRNVVDGLDPKIVQSELYADDDDMQKRKDLLQAANDLVCPLLPS